MFGQRIEEEFSNDPGALQGVRPARGSRALLWVIVLGIAGFFGWAQMFEIEEVVRGPGRVVPAQQVQVVQSLEGGIVRAISVRQGMVVDAGAPLVQIDDTGFAARQGELAEQETALQAEAVRLRAEASGAEAVFPEALRARAPEAVAAEEQVLRTRRLQLETELAVLADQRAQRAGELETLRAEEAKIRAVLAPLTAEIALTEDLAARGVVPEIEVLRLQSRKADLEGDLAIGAARAPVLEAALREAENLIGAARSAFVLTAQERLTNVQRDLAVVEESLRAATDRVTRTQLRAPVRGTVNRVTTTTIGEVVQPGAPVVEIVPLDDSLLIEVEIGPRDVAFVTPGVSASVKLTAYDYLIYGALEGEVTQIGADTVLNADGVPVFRAEIRTGDSFLGDPDRPLPILPGMQASVDIRTGSRTVLDYLAKPLLRAQSEAFRER